MRQVRIYFVIAGVALAVTACAPGGVRNGDDDDIGGHIADAGGNGFIDAVPFIDASGNVGDGGHNSNGACDKMDILFVIDNSGSMSEEQANLATNFPAFVQVIENYTTSAGTHLDYHIGVTTTDHGGAIFGTPDDGQFLVEDRSGLFPTSCMFPNGRRYLQKGDTNVGTKFSCAAKAGTSGSPFEMPLQAAKMALVDRMAGPNASNAGFLREDALLAIVLLTDENDCSTIGVPGGADDPLTYCDGSHLEVVNNYITAFDGVKGGERGRWATAVIAGPGPGICMSAFGSADEAVRLKQFTTMTGTNAVFTSICNGNLAQSLMDAFGTFGVACENIPG